MGVPGGKASRYTERGSLNESIANQCASQDRKAKAEDHVAAEPSQTSFA